jgi:hypothetical protein
MVSLAEATVKGDVTLFHPEPINTHWKNWFDPELEEQDGFVRSFYWDFDSK